MERQLRVSIREELLVRLHKKCQHERPLHLY
jgi:hypothetical protein